MATAQKKRYRLEDIQRDMSDRLYVFNRAKVGKNTCIIQLTHYPERGSPINITLPQTWIPLDLTERAPKSEILQNINFLELLRKGHLEFVPAKEAEQFFDDNPMAVEEREAIDTNQQLVDQQLQEALARVGGQQEDGGVVPNGPAPSTGQIDQTYAGINPSVVDAMTRNDETMNDTKRYGTIRSLIDTVGLNKQDLEFVLKSAAPGGTLAKLAADTLKNL